MSEKVLLTVGGMTCGHCEMRVKKALAAVPGVKDANVSHQAGAAEVDVEGVTREALIEAVKKAGYEAS